MGANYDDRTYPGTLSEQEVREKFAADQDQDRYENGNCYSGGIGMATGITFTGEVFPTQEEAHEYLMDKAEKHGSAIISFGSPSRGSGNPSRTKGHGHD